MNTNFGLVYNEWILLIKKNGSIINVIFISSVFPIAILYFLFGAFYGDIFVHPFRFLLNNIPLFLVIWNILLIKIWVLEASLLIISVLNNDNSEVVSFKKKFDYILSRFIPLTITLYCYMFIVIGGLLLFVVPGIVFMAKYSQAFNFVLIAGDTPIDAFKKSASMTKGHYGGIIWLMFIYSFSGFGSYGMPLVHYILWKMTFLKPLYDETTKPLPPTPPPKRYEKIRYFIISFLILLTVVILYLINR